MVDHDQDSNRMPLRATTSVTDEVDPAGLAIGQGLTTVKVITPANDEVNLEQEPRFQAPPRSVGDIPVCKISWSPYIDIFDNFSDRAAAVDAQTEMYEDRDDAGDNDNNDPNAELMEEPQYDTDLPTPVKSDKDTDSSPVKADKSDIIEVVDLVAPEKSVKSDIIEVVDLAPEKSVNSDIIEVVDLSPEKSVKDTNVCVCVCVCVWGRGGGGCVWYGGGNSIHQ